MKRGIVFGVFDGLHDGHRHFLRESAALCDVLVVVVARDGAVEALKGRLPKKTLAERMASVQAFDTRLLVVPGDAVQGSWDVLTSHTPDVAYLGYDQDMLAQELAARGVPYIYVSAHEPKTYKSSLLNG